MCGNTSSGGVRLVGGATELEGRVEVCLDGEWGTVCDNFWSNLDATVVCHQLSLGKTDAAAIQGAWFGPGTGPIHFNNVFCNGGESMLTDCTHMSSAGSECTHSQDSSVICSGAADIVVVVRCCCYCFCCCFPAQVKYVLMAR